MESLFLLCLFCFVFFFHFFPLCLIFLCICCFSPPSVPGAELVLLMIDLFVKLEAYSPELQQPLQRLLQVTVKPLDFDVDSIFCKG